MSFLDALKIIKLIIAPIFYFIQIFAIALMCSITQISSIKLMSSIALIFHYTNIFFTLAIKSAFTNGFVM